MEYYLTEKIKCKDGIKFFSKERLNDGYCDCPDGTDEPGTSACPESKFYCRNGGQVPLFLFSSRVNDRICDCCDGTDEYDGLVSCPNTCRLDTSTQNREPDVVSEVRKMVDITVPQHSVKLDDLILKFKNLKTLLLLEIILLGWGLVSFLHYQCAKYRRRRHQ